MNLPKVKFQLPTIHKETEMLTYFLTPQNGWDWSDKIYRQHPVLKEILKNKKISEREKYTERYVRDILSKERLQLRALVKHYQNEWDKINDRYLETISRHVETSYPRNIKTIRAYVSIVPIFPRFLDDWAFNVSARDPESMIPIATHEILHFVYFKKWLEVFPKTKKNERDSPHLVWKLSEILDPIILNNNKDIQQLFRQHQGHYDEFQKVMIGNKSMIRHFEDLYKKHIKSSRSFEDFLKICWADVVKYKDTIEKI